jgi:alpha-beta hydrolase superfamily lysophospholipase
MLAQKSGGFIVTVTAALARNQIQGVTAVVPMIAKGGLHTKLYTPFKPIVKRIDWQLSPDFVVYLASWTSIRTRPAHEHPFYVAGAQS